ncbi:cell wall protein DAN4-like isoform X2 [Mugil cephalus]|uniref:cell wall protein DAN4-like isoform X2 n=1 Tax=Mugil cephalus TaxID=48193 RepID=UPI001FB758EA|nr:cell wall protein DAN4-like isoform X2 [Mugil cephalus]
MASWQSYVFLFAFVCMIDFTNGDCTDTLGKIFTTAPLSPNLKERIPIIGTENTKNMLACSLHLSCEDKHNTCCQLLHYCLKVPDDVSEMCKETQETRKEVSLLYIACVINEIVNETTNVSVCDNYDAIREIHLKLLESPSFYDTTTPSTTTLAATATATNTSSSATTHVTTATNTSPSTHAAKATNILLSTHAATATATNTSPSTHTATATNTSPSTHAATATNTSPSTHAATATNISPSTHTATATNTSPSTHTATATNTSPSITTHTATTKTPPPTPTHADTPRSTATLTDTTTEMPRSTTTTKVQRTTTAHETQDSVNGQSSPEISRFSDPNTKYNILTTALITSLFSNAVMLLALFWCRKKHSILQATQADRFSQENEHALEYVSSL